MKKTNLRDKYLSEVGWIISDPMLFNAITLGLLNKQIIRKRVIEKLSIKEAAAFFDHSLPRLEEMEIAALAELKANVSLSVLVANRHDSTVSTSTPLQIAPQARLSDLKDMKPRALNVLNWNEILTVADLLQYNREELLKIRGIGINMVNDLSELFAAVGIKTDWGVNAKKQKAQRASERRPQVRKPPMDASNAQIALKTPLSKLKAIEIRVLNAFRMNDIYTVADALKYDREQLLKFRGFGTKTLSDLSKVFAAIGIITDWDYDPFLWR